MMQFLKLKIRAATSWCSTLVLLLLIACPAAQADLEVCTDFGRTVDLTCAMQNESRHILKVGRVQLVTNCSTQKASNCLASHFFCSILSGCFNESTCKITLDSARLSSDCVDDNLKIVISYSCQAEYVPLSSGSCMSVATVVSVAADGRKDQSSDSVTDVHHTSYNDPLDSETKREKGKDNSVLIAALTTVVVALVFGFIVLSVVIYRRQTRKQRRSARVQYARERTAFSAAPLHEYSNAGYGAQAFESNHLPSAENTYSALERPYGQKLSRSDSKGSKDRVSFTFIDSTGIYEHINVQAGTTSLPRTYVSVDNPFPNQMSINCGFDNQLDADTPSVLLNSEAKL